MGIHRDDGDTTFHCDVCHEERFSPRVPGNWDQKQMPLIAAKEDGWRFKNTRGFWEALCPACAEFDGYVMGPDALDELR